MICFHIHEFVNDFLAIIHFALPIDSIHQLSTQVNTQINALSIYKNKHNCC